MDKFKKEEIRKGIAMGLGSQGIWTPELEDLLFEEIQKQNRFADVAVCNRRELLIDFLKETDLEYVQYQDAQEMLADEILKAICHES